MRGKPGPSWQIHVNLAPDPVFEYVADLQRHPEWAADEMRVETQTEGPLRVGSKFQAASALLNAGHPSTLTVTELTPPIRFAFEAADSSSVTGHEFTFTAYGGGTLVTRQVFIIKQPLAGGLRARLGRTSTDAQHNAALAKMRSNLEHAGAAHPRQPV